MQLSFSDSAEVDTRAANFDAAILWWTAEVGIRVALRNHRVELTVVQWQKRKKKKREKKTLDQLVTSKL